MTNRVVGYKAFNNMKDRFGNEYQPGIIYEIPGTIKFRKNGFHFCTNIADVFRYYDGFDDNTVICEVAGFGDLDKYDDEYYDYLDMYASSKLEILKVLSREEVLEIALNNSAIHILRFISGYKLTDEEIDVVLKRCQSPSVQEYIDYYQKNDKTAFQRRR